MEGCRLLPHDKTTRGPVQRRQVALFVVLSVQNGAYSRNARCPAHCSGRSANGRYCCRVLQRRAHRLFGSAGGQAALGASGRPSPWAGPRVCARGRRGVCAVELVRGRGLQRQGAERSPNGDVNGRALHGQSRNIRCREVKKCTH